jgi:hypothetical protein
LQSSEVVLESFLVHEEKEDVMKVIPIGDYYAWYCEWCDSRNLTLWTRFEKGQVVCGACHNAFALAEQTHNQVPVDGLTRII